MSDTRQNWAVTKTDVLLVTVNENEDDAVQQAFDVKGLFDIGEEPYLRLADINGLRIVRVLSEMGSGGIGASQQTVDQAIRDLHPSTVIAVGIAFGIDETKQSIGDILVSKQLFPYELQRVTQEKDGIHVDWRGDRPHIDSTLLRRVREAWSILRHKATTEHEYRDLVVRFGTVLSGEKLIDSIDYRSQLRAIAPKAIVGGEMEGSGLYVASSKHKTNWIVIKAICDWADGNKNNFNKEEHQKCAARNAAQFTKFLISNIGLPSNAPHKKSISVNDDSPAFESNHADVQIRRITQTTWEADDTRRFLYRTRLTKLYGRETEFRALIDFCNAALIKSGTFRWWLLVGAAGVGKSRIAFELALVLRENGWIAEFMDDIVTNIQAFNQGWAPKKPTLFIVDYASKYVESLHQIILCLSRRCNHFEYPVRLLLLERSAGDWQDRLLGDSLADKADIAGSRHLSAGSALELSELTEKAARQVLSEAVNLYSTKYREMGRAILPNLSLDGLFERLHIRRRPLYALFIADAIVTRTTETILNWDEDQLIEYVVKRDKLHWQRVFKATDLDLDVLYIITLTGSKDLAAGRRFTPYLIELLKEEYSRDDGFERRYLAITGSAEDGQNVLSRLEPDLIGELFVLTHLPLRPNNPFQTQGNEKWNSFIRAIWDTDCCRGTAEFLSRAPYDFPTRSKQFLDLWSIDTSNLTTEISRAAWAISFTGNIASLFDIRKLFKADGFDEESRDTIERIVGICGELELLSLTHHHEALLRHLWVRAAANIVQGPLSAVDIDKAQELNDKIERKFAEYPDESILKELWVRAATGIILMRLFRGEVAGGITLYNRVKKLSDEHPDGAQLRKRRAVVTKTIFEAIYSIDRQAARTELESLKKLSEAHPDEPDLRRTLLEMAVHAAT